MPRTTRIFTNKTNLCASVKFMAFIYLSHGLHKFSRIDKFVGIREIRGKYNPYS